MRLWFEAAGWRQHWPELQDHRQDTQPPHDLTTACFLPLLLPPFLNPQYSCHPEFREPSDMPGGHISCLYSHHLPLSDCFLKLSLWLTFAWICYSPSSWLLHGKSWNTWKISWNTWKILPCISWFFRHWSQSTCGFLWVQFCSLTQYNLQIPGSDLKKKTPASASLVAQD